MCRSPSPASRISATQSGLYLCLNLICRYLHHICFDLRLYWIRSNQCRHLHQHLYKCLYQYFANTGSTEAKAETAEQPRSATNLPRPSSSYPLGRPSVLLSMPSVKKSTGLRPEPSLAMPLVLVGTPSVKKSSGSDLAPSSSLNMPAMAHSTGLQSLSPHGLKVLQPASSGHYYAGYQEVSNQVRSSDMSCLAGHLVRVPVAVYR